MQLTVCFDDIFSFFDDLSCLIVHLGDEHLPKAQDSTLGEIFHLFRLQESSNSDQQSCTGSPTQVVAFCV